jgi:amino acid adenylation domain-containing protein
VVDRVAATVARVPRAPALQDGATILTYSDLWSASGRVATILREAGVGEGALVGLCGAGTADVVVAILGILRAGAAYVPLDETYPPERLGFMLDDSGARVVVTTEQAKARLPRGPHRLVVLEEVLRDVEAPPPVSLPDVRPIDLTALCYVIYTSGSTGRPKGAMLEHRTLANLIRWQVDDSDCGEGDRTLQFSPISFDVSFQEIFATFAAGGTLVCIGTRERRDPHLLWETLSRERVNRLFLPFIALHALALVADALPGGPPPLKEVVTAGEQLQCNAALRRLFRRLPGCRLVNQYGPAEAHVVTRFTLPEDPSDWPSLPPIGEPIDNARLYVTDERGAPCPVGVPGLLSIGGIPAGRGYWGSPRRSAERFAPEPGGEAGSRVFRTGDLVRLRRDGTLDFAGRADDQVKIRGFRIEPGEIESALAGHGGVREAAVAVEGSDPAERKLVAHVAADEGTDAAELRTFLAERLPHFMVPARFELVGALPRTPSGKVDRRLLRAPPPALASRVASGDGSPAAVVRRVTDEVLADAGELTGGFTAAGGDSLSATRVSALLERELEVVVKVSAILESSSFDNLVRIVKAAPKVERRRHEGTGGRLPVSRAQRELLLEDLYDPAAPPHVVMAELVVRGPLSLEHVNTALERLVERHGALRTRYTFDGADFRQEVVPAGEVRAHHAVLRSEADLDELRRSEATRPFDLAEPTVPRVTVASGGDGLQHLLFVLHHVACDGWSLELLVSEFAAEYADALAGRRVRRPTPPQFVDVAELDADPQGDLERAPSFGLPWGKERLPMQDRSLERLAVTVPRPAVQAARELALETGATLFSVLLAAWSLELGRYAGVSNVSVGVPTSGRTNAAALEAIGMFVDTVFVPVELRAGTSCADVVAQVHARILEAHDLQAARHDRPEHRSRVAFVLQPAPPRRLALGPQTEASLVLDLGVPERTPFDLVFSLNDEGDALRGWIDYDAAVFAADVVERIPVDLARRLERMASDSSAPAADPVVSAATPTPPRPRG